MADNPFAKYATSEPKQKGENPFAKYAEKEEAPSQAAAFGKSASESLGGAAGGLAGAELGIAGGTALGAMTGPFAPVAVPALALTGGLVGGLAGGYGGEKLQEYAGELIPESIKEQYGYGRGQRARETQAYPITSGVGKFAPDIAVGGKALYDIGKLGYQSAKELASSLIGKKTAAQQAKLASEATQAGEAGKSALEAERAAAQKATEAEKKATATDISKIQAQPEQAATTAAKEAAKGGRSLRELVGVRTLPELGSYRPIPQTTEKIGEFIRTQADNFLNSIKSQRSKAADVNFSKAKINAAQEEARGRFVDTQPLLAEMDALIEKGGTTDYLNSIRRLRDDLAATKNFEGLEVIRRRLGDAAYGVPEEGYKAIGQKFSQKMYDDLAGQMRDFDKNFAKYLDDYRRLSDPIRVYGTKVGKSLTQTEDAAGRYISKPSEKLAEEIFSSPQNFDRFVEAVGGNSEIATAAARRFFANKLESAKTPEAVEKLVKDNRALLNRFEMKQVNKDIDNYYRSLKQAQTRVGAAKEIAEVSQKRIDELNKAVADADVALSARLKDIEGSKTIVSDAVKALSEAKPGSAVDKFETVLDKIRTAETKAGTKILDEARIDSLRQQALQLDKVTDKARRQIMAAQITAGLLGVGAAVGVAKKTVETIGGQ
jgi:uncharacterized protein YdcH (DUF465 family)